MRHLEVRPEILYSKKSFKDSALAQSRPRATAGHASAGLDCCISKEQTNMRPVNSLWQAVKKMSVAVLGVPNAERLKYRILPSVFVAVWVRGPRAWWTRHRHRLHTRPVSAGGAALSPQFEGKGKLVSVLLPSRGRPQGLLHAVSSLIAKCDNPSCVEILIRLDDDDDSGTQDAAGWLQSVFLETTAIEVITGPRRGGYGSLHEFVDEMCAVAHGDFLFLFNDDLTMDTQGWDTEIARFRDEFCVLSWRISPNPFAKNLFPVVHRKVHQVIGHFSKCCICDTWMENISRRAGIERFCLVRGTHKQHYVKESAQALGTAANRFYSDEMMNLRNADLAKVNAYLDRFGVKIQRTGGSA